MNDVVIGRMFNIGLGMSIIVFDLVKMILFKYCFVDV